MNLNYDKKSYQSIIDEMDFITKFLLLTIYSRKCIKVLELERLKFKNEIEDNAESIDSRLRLLMKGKLINIREIQPNPFEGHEICEIDEDGEKIGEYLREEEITNNFPLIIRYWSNQIRLNEHFEKVPSLEELDIEIRNYIFNDINGG